MKQKLQSLLDSKPWMGPMLAIFLSLCCAVPRFNVNDIGLRAPFDGDWAMRDSSGEVVRSGYSPDVRQYVSYVQYFRHEQPLESVEAPFSQRPLEPFLASFLPFNVMTSLNLVNLFFVVIGVGVFGSILAILKLDKLRQTLGMMLFGVSFPVFYYGATARVDAAGVALSCMAVYACLRRQPILLLASIVVGAFAKETTILSVVFALTYLTASRQPGRMMLFFSVILCFITAIVINHRIAPGTVVHEWSGSMQTLQSNLGRPRALLSTAFAIGLPLVLIVSGFRKKVFRMSDASVLAFGITSLAGLGIWAFSLYSAYTDGRFIWIFYPFLIPLSSLAILHRSSVLPQH